MISSITGFERLMINRNKETQRLQALVDEQAEQIDSLLKTVEALVIACEQAADKERDKCAADYLQDCVNAVEAARLEEREAINLDHRIAQAAGAKKGKKGYWEFDEHELKVFIELSRESEREACAVACESLKLSDDYYTHFYVEAIRARGNK
jgi:hypothetical protein